MINKDIKEGTRLISAEHGMCFFYSWRHGNALVSFPYSSFTIVLSPEDLTESRR